MPRTPLIAAAATLLLFSLFFFDARIAAATPIAFDFRRQFSPITPAELILMAPPPFSPRFDASCRAAVLPRRHFDALR
jgi:hypothetical protein